VLLWGANNVTTEEVAADDPASSAGPSRGACFSTEMADDGSTGEPEVILGHPMLRAPGDVSFDEAMGTARWALTQAQNVLHQELDSAGTKMLELEDVITNRLEAEGHILAEAVAEHVLLCLCGQDLQVSL
jgi:hypothetical protein